MKSIRGSGTRVMSEDHVLKRYDNGVVWDVVLDYIYANVPDEFGREEVIECVSEYYKTNLKRPITPITAHNYAANYIIYMRDEDTPCRIEQCDDPNVPSPVLLYKRVKPEKAIEEETGQKKPPVYGAIMSSDHCLKKYGTTSVYKPILDFILERAPDPFTAGDVSSLIGQYYREDGRTLKESTQELYADRYIKYMRKSDPPIVGRYEDSRVSPLPLYRRIKYAEEPAEIEKEEGSDIADDIYDLAEKEGWTDRKKQVSIAFIKERLPRYSIDEIFSGVTCLIKKHMVSQMPSDEVMF